MVIISQHGQRFSKPVSLLRTSQCLYIAFVLSCFVDHRLIVLMMQEPSQGEGGLALLRKKMNKFQIF